jgi:hypothetical protein
MVKAYEFYLSTDGETWNTPVVSGQFKNTTAMQTTKLSKPTAARYLKFVAKSEVNNNAWTSAAEIGIEATASSTAISTPTVRATTQSGAVYDLQGRRVLSAETSPTLNNQPSTLYTQHSAKKGIFIQNGKKLIR